MSGRADPKPAARHKATRAEWEVLRPMVFAQTGGLCGCGCGKPAESLGHLVGKDLGGDDYSENLLGLNGDGTRGCHGIWETSADGADKIAAGIRETVERDFPEKREYVYFKKGRGFWDRYYPALPLGEPARVAAPARLTEREKAHHASTRSTITASPPPLDETDERSAGERGSRTKAEEGEPICEACGQTVKSGTAAEPPVVKAKATGEKEPARRKRSWRIAVPNDAEDGKAVLDGLVDACREELQPALGWSETVPPYHVLVAVMAAFLRGEKAQAA